MSITKLLTLLIIILPIASMYFTTKTETPTNPTPAITQEAVVETKTTINPDVEMPCLTGRAQNNPETGEPYCATFN